MVTPSQGPDGSHSLPSAHLLLHPDRRPGIGVLPHKPKAAADDDVQTARTLPLPA